MAWQSILDRFRPVGAPGPAGPAGVPSQDATGPAAELAAVFEALRPDVEQASRTVAEARVRAQRLVADARDGAAAELAAARSRAPAVREEARLAAEQQAASEAEALTARADAEVAVLAERGRARLPGMVDDVLSRLVEQP
ncbi:hypothetical protein Q6348_07120 [Isoptericola sp. b441]|uniref:ATPase n=1 Tax=Actinotalea lenta TaxID=3064654 RepID=A0ABT9D7X8_9CELL|nr:MULTISPECIES: hypothetical protein [unclassified Isoptericola]MDO8106967.1 hypothetical protein [Isoptericola sp. b441]MDO8121323.1 hypothetical protein [Isoptericola sp. b490]